MKIELQDIEKYYDDYCVFDDLTATFSSNLIKIDGENGCGKSTLLKILSAATSFKGNILINDIKRNKEFLQRNVILVHQDIILLENKTVMGNLRILHISKDNIYIKNFLDEDLFSHQVKELSGGQKKLLSLAIAFALEPCILLLDEFSNYLDEAHLEKMRDLIIQYSKNHMVIYVDHLVDLGGDVFCLDSVLMNNRTSLSSIDMKNKSFKISFYYFMNQFKLIPTISILVNFTLFVFILFCLTILSANPYRIAAEYYLKNNFNYVQVKPTINNVDYALYYGTVIPISERLNGLEDFYYVTYCEKFDFPLKDEIEEIQGYTSCYVFDINSDALGSKFQYRNTNYYVKGVIDYPFSDDPSIVSFGTFIIEEEKPLEVPTYITLAHFSSEDELIQAFNEELVYIENSGFLSKINEDLRKSTFIILLIIVIFTNLLYQILANLFYVREIKDTCLFLKQYGNSNLELMCSKIGAEFIKYLCIGIGGYFLASYLITLYEKNVIFPWSSFMKPNLFTSILALLIFFGFSEGFYSFFSKRKNK